MVIVLVYEFCVQLVCVISYIWIKIVKESLLLDRVWSVWRYKMNRYISFLSHPLDWLNPVYKTWSFTSRLWSNYGELIIVIYIMTRGYKCQQNYCWSKLPFFEIYWNRNVREQILVQTISDFIKRFCCIIIHEMLRP